MKVTKFGGTSLACADHILKCKQITESDPERRFVVVSAPGKCPGLFDRKITDLLLDAHTQLCYADVCASLDLVTERFTNLTRELNIDMKKEIERTREEILINRCDRDFVISRGEYLMAQIFAELLGFKFIDAANFLVIKNNGLVDERASCDLFKSIRAQLAQSPSARFVMGGFYGKGLNGGIKTFPRGGSDYSGAIAAVCLNAELYENFTDTHGVQTANPALVPNTQNITEIDYTTLYKLCQGGASVIYPNCLPLLRRHSTPLKVDNTFAPGKKFTLVTNKKPNSPYFSVTYETKQNIHKNTVEILVVIYKTDLALNDLRALLSDTEVYLLEFTRSHFRLLAPTFNLEPIVKILHTNLKLRIDNTTNI